MTRRSTTVPCGCIYITENAWVKDIKLCSEHIHIFDDSFVQDDQEIEDAIFNGEINHDKENS